LPYTYYIFNKLGAIDFNKLEEKFIDPEEMQIKQYINYESLYANMHKIFNCKNELFCRMLFLWLSDHGNLNQPISYKQFLKKLMPVWSKKLRED